MSKDIEEADNDGRTAWIRGAATIWGTLPKLLACRAYSLGGPKGALTTDGNQIPPDMLKFLDLPWQENFDMDYAAVCALRDELEVAPIAGGLLLNNLRMLGKGMALEEGAVQLLHLRIVERLSLPFSLALRPRLLNCIDPVFYMNLDAILKLEPGSTEQLLSPDSALTKSGLLFFQRGVGSPLEDRLRLPQGLMAGLLKPLPSLPDAIRRLVPLARPGTLTLDDYPHLAKEVVLLTGHIERALVEKRAGVNVLLHGDPGVGKTELVSAIAKQLDATLFAIGGVDQESARDRSVVRRLDRFRFAQGLVRSAGKSLLLVDEAEDLFPVSWREPKDDVPTKALLNETLETNLVPTFWLTNRPGRIDEAFMRRFDLVLRIAAPDRRHKAVLLSKHVPALIEEVRWSTHAVGHPKISPAVIARMGRVVAGIEPADACTAKETFELLSHEYLEALGEANTSSASPLGQEIAYAVAWLNPDVPLKPVLEQLGTHGRGRLLLHGLPGTGKTALAHHLAEQLGRGILVKRGSDLMSMWVGETEKNLRKMFDEARREGDVLLLDEADSFLSARSANQTRWQTTQTNELLTQMEAFDGLFVCTTNLLDQLDPAAMRRFDLKVGFNPLRSEQRIGLIREACLARQLGWDMDVEAAVTRRQSDLVGLTPGDLAAGLRKLRLSLAAPQAADLLEALVSECRYKSAHRPKIGFV